MLMLRLRVVSRALRWLVMLRQPVPKAWRACRPKRHVTVMRWRSIVVVQRQVVFPATVKDVLAIVIARTTRIYKRCPAAVPVGLVDATPAMIVRTWRRPTVGPTAIKVVRRASAAHASHA